jgi:3-polyprenyl-4-hydroxybenzoate decarboxylase
VVVVLPAGLIREGDAQALVWAALANIDPERDLIFNETPEQVDGRWMLKRHPRHLLIDATKKDARDGFVRDWPEMQVHPPEVLARVKQLLVSHGIEMPTDYLPQGG